DSIIKAVPIRIVATAARKSIFGSKAALAACRWNSFESQQSHSLNILRFAETSFPSRRLLVLNLHGLTEQPRAETNPKATGAFSQECLHANQAHFSAHFLPGHRMDGLSVRLCDRAGSGNERNLRRESNLQRFRMSYGQSGQCSRRERDDFRSPG